MGIAGAPVSRILALFLPSLMVIFAIVWVYGLAEIRNRQTVLYISANRAVTLIATALREKLLGMAGSVDYLANLPELRRAIEHPSAATLESLVDNWSVYMAAHGTFDQLRWIGPEGRELLRLNMADGQVVRVPESELQQKVARPYFVEAMRLPEGAIFVSPLDLNVERGEIEVPFKPTIRFAQPLFDDAGARQGVLVVNYLGRFLLEEFAKVGTVGSQSLMLLNAEGFSLRSDTPADDWEFMHDREAEFPKRHPEAWRIMDASPQGEVMLPDGLWRWTSISPATTLKEGHASSTYDAVIVGDVRDDWRVVSWTPSAAVTAISRRVWIQFAPLFALLVLIAAIVSVWAARARESILQLNRQLEERAAAAEASSQAKAAFLANMSHEIRTPMNAILGLGYLLSKQELPPDALSLVKKIKNAGRTLQSIINDILDYSKIEADRLEIEHAPFRLGEVLDNLATIMSVSAGSKNIELVISPPPPGTDALVGDALRLEQILINLTSNAIKFTDVGEVTVSIVMLSQTDEGVTLRFSVKDTGIGIAEERQKEIFSAFTQADTSMTRRFGGTGLGLTITARLVALMGGEIGVESELSKGSTFWFVLPLERAREVQFSSPEMMRLNVLIADDHAGAREALRKTAEGLGWTAQVFGSGQTLVEHVLAQQGQPSSHDLVVLDWQMPGMDGLSAARAIRDVLPEAREPIVVMVTAHTREALAALPNSDLADAILDKPVTTSALYDAVLEAKRKRLGPPNEASVPGGRQLQGMRVLVVDDSEINLEVARRILESEGAVVSSASNGVAAVDWLRSHGGEVDIVLMDVQMPQMNGYEATHALRGLPGLGALPVVALTAGAFKEQRDAAMQSGMDGFLSKPFDVPATIALLRRLARWKDAPPAPPVAPAPSEHLSAEDLPGLAVSKGLAVWRDPTVYQAYLRKFVKDYAHCAQAFASLDPADAGAFAHKLKGAAANLALGDVAAVAGEVERAQAAGESADSVVARLQSALEVACSSIAAYAGADEETADPVDAPIANDQLAGLLKRALTACDADNPDEIEELLKPLGKLVPAEQLAPLRTAVENFDWRGAEAAVRTLATQTGVVMGE